jgi:hypothetical protein
LDKFEKRREWREKGFRVDSGITRGVEAIGDPDANLPPEGGHVCQGSSGRREDLSAIQEGRSYEDLSEVSGSAWVEAFAQVGESPDLDPGVFGEGESFGEVLVGGVVVLEPVA